MRKPSICRRPARVPWTALVLAACVVAQPAPSSGEETTVPAAGSEGLKVSVDPQTGRLLDTPATEPATGAASPPGAPPAIEVRPSAVPGGGFGFRVPDSLHPEIRATTTPDGNAHVACGEEDK